MIYDFSADDILTIAEQLERNGAAFYHMASKSITDSASQKLLLDLAKMEEAHEKTFATMRADLHEREKTSTVFDPEGEAVAYLRALADTRVFFEKKMDVSSVDKIYMTAIGAEKDSIVFYLGMKDLVSETFGRGRIDTIIREEMGHLTVLSRELASFKRSTRG